MGMVYPMHSASVSVRMTEFEIVANIVTEHSELVAQKVQKFVKDIIVQTAP